MTKDDYRETLKEILKEVTNELKSGLVTDEQEKLVQKKQAEIHYALSNPQGLEESYLARIKELEEQIAQLQALKEAIPKRLLDEAIAALRQGDDQKALNVFKKVDKLTELPSPLPPSRNFSKD